MICSNCSRSVPDGTRYCPYCGAAADGAVNAYDFSEEKTISGFNGFYSPSSGAVNEEKTVSGFDGFYPQPPKTHEAFDRQPEPVHRTSQQMVDNQPVGTVRQWDNPFPPEAYPAQQYNNPPVQPYTPPYSQNTVTPAPLPKQRNGSKIIAASVIFTVMAVMAFVVFIVVYTSDWFKLAQAESAMLDGKYEDALQTIKELDSDRAEAVRGFADVMKLRDELKEQYSNDSLFDMDSEAYQKAKDFKEKLTSFTKDYKPAELTEKLSDLYESYADAAGDVAELLYDSEVSTDFATAQNTFTEYAKRKHGEKFTVQSMTAVKDATKTAYDNIGKKLMNTGKYKDFTASCNDKAVSTMSEFYNNINSRIAQDEHELKDADKYKDKEVSYENTDSSYKPYVADGLKDADSQENITSNAETLIASLDCAMLVNSFDKTEE